LIVYIFVIKYLIVYDYALSEKMILLKSELGRVLHNYFDSSTKLFSDLYLAKILDISAKLFFHVAKF